jgi:hypothetical protein
VDYTIGWSLLQASLRGFPLTFERVSIAIDGVTVKGAAEPPLGQARHVELHLRLRPDTPQPVFDLAVQTDDATIPLVPALAQHAFDGDAQAVVRGLKDLAPKPFTQHLRDWQANGGRLDVTRLRFAQGEARALADGQLGLTANGHLDGNLRVMLAGLEQLAALLLGGSDQARAQASLLGGLALLAGRSEVEGKRAVALPLRFKDGAVFLGPLQLGRIPSLYPPAAATNG